MNGLKTMIQPLDYEMGQKVEFAFREGCVAAIAFPIL